MIRWVSNIVALLVLPVWLSGVVNRVKSRWGGRQGPPLMQLGYDLWRLARKEPVYSTATSPLFAIGPWLQLLAAAGSACIVPLAGVAPVVSFPFDFVWFAYVAGLGRVAVALAALDTGSSLEGMGAAREMTFASLVEPAFFLIAGALALSSRVPCLDALLAPELRGGAALIVWAAAVAGLFVVLQVEAGRMPVDDPTTHLELTMVHEVMVLDHSGPDLAAVQAAAALKLALGAAMLARLLNPWARTASWLAPAVHVVLCTLVAALIGTVESVTARLKLRAVPAYIALGVIAGLVALGTAAVQR